MDKNRTTLSGITPQHLIRLQKVALYMLGERSVSALIRHIAEHGYMSLDEGLINLQLVVPSNRGDAESLLNLEIPKKEVDITMR